MIKHFWTPAMMATLKALHRKGGSFEEMAIEMSAIFKTEISRNALIGKARRMELPMRSTEGPRKPPLTPPKPASRPVPVAAPIPPPPEPIAAEPGLSIYQLAGDTCRWPLGKVSDRPPYRYCGETTPFEEVYCTKHRAIGYNRSPYTKAST